MTESWPTSLPSHRKQVLSPLPASTWRSRQLYARLVSAPMNHSILTGPLFRSMLYLQGVGGRKGWGLVEGGCGRELLLAVQTVAPYHERRRAAAGPCWPRSPASKVLCCFPAEVYSAASRNLLLLGATPNCSTQRNCALQLPPPAEGGLPALVPVEVVRQLAPEGLQAQGQAPISRRRA